MGTQSKSREKSTTHATETTTPTYQNYAGDVAQGLAGSMPGAYNITMKDYGSTPGYNATQQSLWSQMGQDIYGRYGTEGPAGQYAGAGYMNTLNPYYQKQQQYIESALPQEKSAYLQQLKNEFGPAWGTSGKALAAAGESYANWQAAKARELGGIESQKAAAQERGMGYSAAYNPFSWAQQAIGYAGAPETATSDIRKAQQQEAMGWITPMLQLATMGYTFPQSTTTVGDQASRGTTSGKSAGMSCCFIMNEAGDLTDAVRQARDFRYKNDLEVADGYKKMAVWLVPLMQKSPVVKCLVKWIMTHPIAKVAEVRKINKHQPALYPIGLFWEAVWRVYGLSGTDQFTFNYVIKRLARSTSM